MLSINMRVFKTVLFIASVGASVTGAVPIAGESDDAKTVAPSVNPPPAATTASLPAALRSDTDYYDQRQNGTENYRIHVDGVVLVFAPVEALLLAGAATGITDSALPTIDHNETLQQLGNETSKPSVPNEMEAPVPKTTHKLRLANLLGPFLRRIRHERGPSSSAH